MIIFIPPRIPWVMVWLIVFYAIYDYKWRNTTWKKKSKLGKTTVLILTLILSPFAFWGTYNFIGIENGGLFEGDGGAFSLGPGETFTSDTLSNQFTLVGTDLSLTTDGGNITFYLCDENTPEIRYGVVNISGGDWMYLSLPYLYSGFLSISNWTLNFYNPSPNTSVSGTFEIGYNMDLPPTSIYRSIALRNYQEPVIALLSMWSMAGVVTLWARNKKRKSLGQDSEDQKVVEITEVEEGDSTTT